MFTGIIEAIGKIKKLKPEGTNLHITIKAPFIKEIKIDESIAHNGVCLTVVDIFSDSYMVTAIDETLKKTNLSTLKEGDEVNLERAIKTGSRLDGHIVQGHVDTTATLIDKKSFAGSNILTFSYPEKDAPLLVEKGSIALNGISLTVFDVTQNTFSVAIIPYTWQQTNIKTINTGDKVNIEFDILGKYVKKNMEVYFQAKPT